MTATAAVQAMLDDLGAHSPAALELAVAVSGAVRVEQSLVRRLRLRLLPSADPSAEADLWFSPLVRARSALGITLRSDAASALRDRLAVRPDREAVQAEIARAHAAQPPLLTLEERLVWLGIVAADAGTIHRELARVLKAMTASPARRDDLSAWCVRALPQLPLAVQRNGAAWMLRIAAQAMVPIAIPLDGDPPSNLVDSCIPSLLPAPRRDQVVAVRRSRDEVIFDAAPDAPGVTVRVPGTDPLFVVVDHDNLRDVVAIPRGQCRSLRCTAASIDLRCLRGNHWRLAARSPSVDRVREDRQYRWRDEVVWTRTFEQLDDVASASSISHSRTPASETTDPRAVAFCRADGPVVFSSVAHGAQVHERDPFDVEAIHVEARERYHRLLERATTPEQAQRGHSRMMLILGESGAGKTHLLRALRAQTHGRRLGYVAYLQLRSNGTDHTRNVLRSLVDSLEQPYDAPSRAESGLMYLSDGLVEGGEAVSPDDLERLRVADLSATELEPFIGGLVDRIVRSVGLGRLEVDLIQALLLLQRRDPAMQRRIVRFLRCEALSPSDRQLLGGVGSRDRADDPLRTIQQLAMVMYELQLAALVVLVDDMENAVADGLAVTQLQQALDSLRAIADAIPSSVIVIACLRDVYDAVKPKLAQGLIDRLGRDEVRLANQRLPEEIEQLLVHRLSYLYSFFGVALRDEDPLYPFTPTQIKAVSQWRTRDVLHKFGEFQMACVAAGHVVPTTAIRTPTPVPGLPATDMLGLDMLWHETLAASVTPLEDREVLALVARALQAASNDSGLSLDVRPVEHQGLSAVRIEATRLPRRLVAVCNNAPQRGSFAAQLAALQLFATEAAAMPVALRNGDFKFQPKTKTAQDVARLIVAGGRAVPLAESHLRVAAAAVTLLAGNSAGSPVWRRAIQALPELPFVREILDLDSEQAPRLDQTTSRR